MCTYFEQEDEPSGQLGLAYLDLYSGRQMPKLVPSLPMHQDGVPYTVGSVGHTQVSGLPVSKDMARTGGMACKEGGFVQLIHLGQSRS